MRDAAQVVLGAWRQHTDGADTTTEELVTRPDDDREVPESGAADDEEPIEEPAGSLPFEAEPADALEQARALPPDDDDYREG